MGDVLLGYYEIPEHLDEPLNTVVNPIGQEVSWREPRSACLLPACMFAP